MKLLGYFVGKAISGIFHVYVVVERERESLHALPIQTSVRYFMNLKKIGISKVTAYRYGTSI